MKTTKIFFTDCRYWSTIDGDQWIDLIRWLKPHESTTLSFTPISSLTPWEKFAHVFDGPFWRRTLKSSGPLLRSSVPRVNCHYPTTSKHRSHQVIFVSSIKES